MEGIVSIVIDDYSADKFVVQVVDTGKGISSEDLKQIFVMYGRIKEYQMNLQSEGVGLGLSTAKQMIEYLDGTIKIESELGKGTIVCFTMLKQMNELQK